MLHRRGLKEYLCLIAVDIGIGELTVYFEFSLPSKFYLNIINICFKYRLSGEHQVPSRLRW